MRATGTLFADLSLSSPNKLNLSIKLRNKGKKDAPLTEASYYQKVFPKT
jgi:hypothetical protein